MTRTIKRTFLASLLTSIALSAILGIVAILSGMQNEWAAKIFITALTICGTSLACFVSSIPLDKRRVMPLAWAGIAIPLIAAFICVILIWAWEPIREIVSFYYYPTIPWRAEELIGKTILDIIYFAIATSASAVLLSPRLRSVGFWVQVSTVGLVVFSFLLIQIPMWAGTDETLWRLWEVSLILCVAGLITTPIIARFFIIKTDEELNALTRTLHLTCPRCLTVQDMTLGESRCVHCKLKFKLEVEEPRCPKCNYILHGLTQPRCPECGELFNTEELASQSSPITSPAQGSSSPNESHPPVNP